MHDGDDGADGVDASVLGRVCYATLGSLDFRVARWLRGHPPVESKKNNDINFSGRRARLCGGR